MSRIDDENLKYPKLITRTYKSGKQYYYFNSVDKETKARKEIALGSDKRIAIAKYKKLYQIHNYKEFISVPLGYEKVLYRNLLKNAKSRGIEVFVTLDDIKNILDQTNGKCSISGIKFNMYKADYKMRPWIPSIDRIDLSVGYTVDNIRIICAYANLAINQYGIEAFIYLANMLKRKR